MERDSQSEVSSLLRSVGLGLALSACSLTSCSSAAPAAIDGAATLPPTAASAATLAGAPSTAGMPALPSAGSTAAGTGSQPITGLPPTAGVAAAPAGQPASPTSAAGAGATGNTLIGAVAGAAASGGAQAPEPAPDAKLTITVPQVAPGAEDTQCVVLHLPGSAPMNVVKLHNTLTTGSHHFILTALNDPNAPEQALARCQGFGGSVTGAPLTITQAHDDHVQLPEGVGYRLAAGQAMHLEMHYINTTDRALDISATSELFAAAPDAQIQPGAVLLVGTADFDIPAHGMLETKPKFLALPAGMDGVKFYAITGHTHRMGTQVNVSLASSSMTPSMQLYAPAHFDWESPETTQLTPHVTVPSGGGFMLQCAWNNTSETELRWGESATAEMCFFWAYYYPRKDVFSIVVDNIDQDTLKQIAGLPPSSP